MSENELHQSGHLLCWVWVAVLSYCRPKRVVKWLKIECVSNIGDFAHQSRSNSKYFINFSILIFLTSFLNCHLYLISAQPSKTIKFIKFGCLSRESLSYSSIFIIHWHVGHKVGLEPYERSTRTVQKQKLTTKVGSKRKPARVQIREDTKPQKKAEKRWHDKEVAR